MSTIVTRAAKGSALTHNEVDANFVNLNTDKIQSGDTVAALTITSATINGGTITGNLVVNGTTTMNGAAGSGYTGFKNRIINGDMRIDQRNNGASQTVTTSGTYTVDRFFVQPTGASVTTQRVSGSGQYQNALRITGAASVTQCFVQQKIEASNSYDLAGQAVTVTIRASSSTLTSLTCYVERATAGVDNWSTFATDKTQAISITSTPTDYTFQATLSGSATNGIRFIFATGAFTSGTLDITGVQLEPGSNATSFEVIDYGRQLMQCQRYLPVVKGGLNLVTTLGQCISATTAILVFPFSTPPRTAPTGISLGTSISAYSTSNAAGGNTTLTGLIFAQAGINAGTLTATVAGGLVAGNASYFFTVADILWNGCEL